MNNISIREYSAAHTTSSINSHYCDGISLTHGNPRSHIWIYSTDNDFYCHCPCGKDSRSLFVGSDYYCDYFVTIILERQPIWLNLRLISLV